MCRDSIKSGGSIGKHLVMHVSYVRPNKHDCRRSSTNVQGACVLCRFSNGESTCRAARNRCGGGSGHWLVWNLDLLMDRASRCKSASRLLSMVATDRLLSREKTHAMLSYAVSEKQSWSGLHFPDLCPPGLAWSVEVQKSSFKTVH